MFKNNRNTIVSLKKKRNMINLEDYDTKSLLTVGMIVMTLILSILIIASSPNSNMLMGV